MGIKEKRKRQDDETLDGYSTGISSVHLNFQSTGDHAYLIETSASEVCTESCDTAAPSISAARSGFEIESYWFGLLSFERNESRLVWRGYWLGKSDEGSVGSYTGPRSEFLYIGPKVHESLVLRNGLLYPVSGDFNGNYTMSLKMKDQMQDGEESVENASRQETIQDFCDTEFTLEFDIILSTDAVLKYSVVGRGCNEFGSFILRGNYNAVTRMLDIIKLYVTNEDERFHMTIAELKFHNVPQSLSHSTLPKPSPKSISTPAVYANSVLSKEKSESPPPLVQAHAHALITSSLRVVQKADPVQTTTAPVTSPTVQEPKGQSEVALTIASSIPDPAGGDV